ncbi:GNAT family N-acetyltransferase [Shewanella sp. 10N.286.52.B9]|uniref:GNAT family N-acetyltransferase n=1 Tax=Shewanella sp. 10N.286.52.B9 TaxID=1880837 RepID=UPI000C82B674|nr:GNAT family N-acetyltransferase [Shewanella sp. 10N.286.52.B9]PMG46520.1 GNAT family N-acetyltransferase [Shewanella sp. 10N.286.52.B9]
MNSIIELTGTITETPRLILRPFVEEDAEAIFLMNSIPEILTYIPQDPLTSIEEARDVFHHIINASYQEFGFGRWAVHHKQDNKIIGFCGPKYIPEYDKVEIGYRYLPEYWGKGIGYEAAQAAVNTLKPQFDIDLIIALILHGNTGSEAIAKKLGMSIHEESEYLGSKVHVYQMAL